MKKNAYYGSIDLTVLSQIAQQQPSLIRKSTLKSDGKEHKFINISILLDDQEDGYGNIGAIRVDCKQSDQIAGLKYFAGNLKKSKFQDQPQSNQPAPSQFVDYDDDLGF